MGGGGGEERESLLAEYPTLYKLQLFHLLSNIFSSNMLSHCLYSPSTRIFLEIYSQLLHEDCTTLKKKNCDGLQSGRKFSTYCTRGVCLSLDCALTENGFICFLAVQMSHI